MKIQVITVLLGLALSQTAFLQKSVAGENPYTTFPRASAYHFQGTAHEAELLADEINRVISFQQDSLRFPQFVKNKLVNADDILSGKKTIRGDMLNVIKSRGQVAIDSHMMTRVYDGSGVEFSSPSLHVVDNRQDYRFIGTVGETEQLVHDIKEYQTRFPGKTEFAATKLISGEQVVSGGLINAMKRSGYLKFGARLFKQVTAVGIVTGAVVGTASAAQAATVRQDMPVGGAPIKIESSNVGASTDFDSYGSSSAPAPRSSGTTR